MLDHIGCFDHEEYVVISGVDTRLVSQKLGGKRHNDIQPQKRVEAKPCINHNPMIIGDRADANTTTSITSALISPINRVPYISAMKAAFAGMPIARPKNIKNNGTPMSIEPNSRAARMRIW